MPDGAHMKLTEDSAICLDLEDSLLRLDQRQLSAALNVRVDDRILVFTQEDVQCGAALQRLKGLKRLIGALKEPSTPNVQALRSGKPVLHPRVAEILDALRQKD